jgi:hypothetical protein
MAVRQQCARALTLAAVAAALCAQPARPAKGPRLFDAVVAVVGDRPILYSSIEREFQSLVSSAVRQGEQLTPQIERAIRSNILNKLEEEARLAQASKLMNTGVRDQIDTIVEESLKDYEAREVRRAGGYDSFMQELGLVGKTLDSVIEDQRTRIQAELAQQQIMSRRIRDQAALLVTPREIRTFFDDNPEQFSRPRSADLAVLALRVEDPATARTDAERVAQAWRAPGKTAEQVRAELAELPLSVLPGEAGVTDSPKDARRDWIKRFAASAAPDEVSAPQPLGGALWILKAVRIEDARQDSFDDPSVQTRIRATLQERKLQDYRMRLLERSKRSIQRWLPPWVQG